MLFVRALALAALPAVVVAAPQDPAVELLLSGELECPQHLRPREDRAVAHRGAVPGTPVAEIDPVTGDLTLMRWMNVESRLVSDPVPFVVREGTVGLTVRAQALSDDYWISVELLDERGRPLACLECPAAPAVGEVMPGRGTTQMPSTDRPGWELEPGDYAFRVRAIPEDETQHGPGPGTTSIVTATFRSDVAPSVEHFLDVNFVYLPGSNLSEAIADTSSHFALLLEKTEEWMSDTGIRFGDVTHVDLDAPQFSVIRTWEEAGRMFRTSRDVGRTRALNVYCVENFQPPLYPVVGLSGGIPGPYENGTRDSGIAMRMSPFFSCEECVDAYASLFAHEIGHYLGFYHTTSADLENEDPFSDTPRCWEPNLRDCPDWNYGMFPVIHPANTDWSPGQATVAKTHPFVRTVAVVAPRAAGPRIAARVAPNPFGESVRVSFDAPLAGVPRPAGVYDVRGRRIRQLTPGRDDLVWDGRDERGRSVPAGVYFIRVPTSGEDRTLRVVKTR